ncbi:MAG: hypothetical protein K6E51_14220 [Treponema sp.]|nr:hypothetical protein [Treponema sp.]
MKKGFFLTIVVTMLVAFSVSAQESNFQGKSNLSYENVPIYKILDGQGGYVVIYAKYGAAVGKATLPKAWIKSSVENPAKLVFRAAPRGIKPYMTYVKKDGAFYKVILTAPVSRTDSVWGVVERGAKLEGTDKDTLELEL